MKLDGKVIWVTGASSGIGEALVYQLAKKNCKIILSARRVQELERVKNQAQLNDNQCLILQLDMEKPETFNFAFEQVLQKFSYLDVLILNAGISQRSLAKDTLLEVDKKLINVNFIGTIALAKTVIPHFLQRKQGCFAVVTSVTGLYATPWRSSYAASKHALHGFFDALRAELHDENIQVTIIAPGFVRTNISLNALTADGTPLNQMDEGQAKGISAEKCARDIIKGIEKNKNLVLTGGFKEILGVYLKRFFPGLFAKLIRKLKVR
jgi:short-subunit dehydrogenase